MEEFNIYTLGAGFYLEKIFNAIRLIIDGDKGERTFVSIMKFASMGAVVVLAIRAGINNDFKSAVKWFLGVTILVGMFLTARATVHIHDTLPDSYGYMAAPRTVQNVPWGLAFLGSTTSQVGHYLASKYDSSFAGVFVSSDYQKTGMLFGSKIVEDMSKLRIADSGMKAFMVSFYKRCIVPDLRTGHNRVNGYTVKDLVDSDNILQFLKDHSSKARLIHLPKDFKLGSRSQANEKNEIVDGYISCNMAAHLIDGVLNQEAERRIPTIASSFLSYFFPDDKSASLDKSEMFKSVLASSYGIFLRKSSKEAKDILLQNVMINAVGDNVDSYNKSYGRVTTEEMTKSAFYSVAQMAQRFVPILRAVLECLFYGVFPLVMVLLVTPIGLEVLKNYGFSFIYLQLWQPMYAILFCIAAAWGKHYSAGIDTLTFANHLKISRINGEISAVAGYMLALVPVLSLFITRGMVSSMGNLSSSIFYIPQTAAVQNAEASVKGNYQLGTTSLDTHSFNTSSANKHDDNYSWMSGMKSFAMPSGAVEKTYADGRSGIESSGAVSNMAGLARVDWNKAVGSRFDQSINDQMSSAERHSSNMVESATSGYSKLLGFDKNFSKGSNAYENWQNNLSVDQRTALDEARSHVSKFAETHGMSQQDALKLAVAGNTSFGVGKEKGVFFKALGSVGFDGSTGATKDESFNKALETAQDSRFANNLTKVSGAAFSGSHQEVNSSASNVLEGARSDLAKSQSAGHEASKAFDHVYSLQESKGRFEQNSGNISQDLSNKFAEDGIKEYGATQFERIVRDDPVRTNQMLNKFLDSNITPKIDVGGQEYDNFRDNFNTSQKSLSAHHQQQVTSIEKGFDSNQNKVVPNNFKKEVSENLAESSKTKDHVNDEINKQSVVLENSKALINDQSSALQHKAEDKTSQSATKRLKDSWTD